MDASINEVTVNGSVYVLKDSIGAHSVDTSGLKYCIVRTYSAGVFAGFVKREKDSRESTVYHARRIWQWAGAASLSQLATLGTSKPDECKFPDAVSEVTLTEVIEIIPCTAKAKKSIEGVKIWEE